MTNVTIKQLRYFEALAQQRHFGRAAAVCAISQPALSVQIKELEQDMGQALFERSARQVTLTPFGEAFATRARAIVQAVDELGEFSRAARDPLVGKFRMGIIPTIAPYLLPQLIQRLSHKHQGLDLHVRETTTPRLVEELMCGQIDVAVVALPIAEPALTEMALFSENFVLVRPITESEMPVPKAKELSDMRLLLLEEGHCFRDQALSFCQGQSGPPRDGLDGSSLSTLVQMVGAGIGVTIIPDMARAVETRSAAVVCDAFPAPQPGRTIGMIWRKSNPMGAAFQEIAKVVKETGEAMQGAHAPGAKPVR